VALALARHGPPPPVPAVSPDRVDLHRALGRLAPRHREVLVLRYVAELSVAEVAAQLRLPAGTVKSRLSRARRALAEEVGDPREGWPMREEVLREQLLGYARDGAEQAAQPGPADIRRRARRHYRRLAALTVVLAAGGIGLGLRAGSVPIVKPPRPPMTVAPHKAAPPESFVTVIQGGAGADSGDLAVVSTATGEMIRSLAPATDTAFTVSHDRRWVYYTSTFPSQGIYRVSLAGGVAEKVTTVAESSALAVSPDGAKLAWEVLSGKSRNRPALRVRDLARGTERVLPVPGPRSGPETISRGHWAWSPDSRQIAMLVTHGISRGYVELMTVDVATGRWRHRFNLDAKHVGGHECCVAMAWPAGGRGIALVRTTVDPGSNPGDPSLTYRLVYVNPTTGAATPGVVLAAGRSVYPWPLDFDASGRYVLYGLQDTNTVSTWWSKGGEPVRVKRIELGNQVPAEVAEAYVGGDW
jgi:hypothetical protein